jgi:hypothetical protein
VGRGKGTRRPGETEEDWPTVEVPPRRPPQPGFSRIDTLPEDFFRSLGQRQLVVGEIIGERYRLIERLGSGAMGDVYVAENSTIGLRVAV